jgi:hypothetical protein
MVPILGPKEQSGFNEGVVGHLRPKKYNTAAIYVQPQFGSFLPANHAGKS